ncbi:hypothetical protein J3R30DRAFT_3341147 [Lentinula aciculospora]|uniref:Crinkler family protein n=1 Tax=Lentinula aciculospora TaxID=153920 RepID=A0A9W9DIU7_9AGAR|nr:hypothetical protein J3R30DRAFT_3341147 [Lentinula aciculospora]
MEHYGPERKLLYVRAEYLRMYEYINYCIGLRRDGITASSPAVIITGQPGVGKTVGSSYFLRRRLGEKKPTMLLQGGIYHLFHDIGVDRVAKGSSVFTNKFKGFSEPPWCLIDSADAPDGIPRSVVGIGLSGVNPIYISSPNNSRWSKLHQSRTKYVAIMNPWTEKELVVASERLLGPERTEETLRRLERWGPTARLCLGSSANDILSHDSLCQNAIDRMDKVSATLNSIIEYSQELKADRPRPDEKAQRVLGQESHKICLIERPDVNKVSNEHRLLITSREIAVRCALRIKRNDEAEVLDMWNLFSKHADARGMTGAIFKAYFHNIFRRQIVMDGLEMFQAPSGKYHASFVDFGGKPGLNAALKAACNAPRSLDNFHVDFKPVSCSVFNNSKDVINVQDHVYYQPASKMQAGIDSFFTDNGYLYLIQMTGALTHNIKDSLSTLLKRLVGAPSDKSYWRFVFVIPKDVDSFDCPKPQIELGKLFTGRIEMKVTVESETEDE